MLNEISQAAYILLLCLFVPVPYATDRNIRRTPWITYALMLANFVVFFAFIFPALGTDHENDIFALWGVIPRSPNLLNLLTYIFLHVSIAHLFWNSVFLWLFGPSCEDAIGSVPYLLLYIAGGAVAGLLHTAIVLLVAQNSDIAFAPMVGASGAISAVIGLYAIRFYRSKLNIIWGCAAFLNLKTATFQVPAIAGLALWFLQNLAGAVSSLFMPNKDGIAYWAHIGGFIFGMTVAEFSGMLGKGMREYLFADAVSAGERGEDGVRHAVSNFRLLLQRRPGDSEVREALALLAQQSMEQGSSVAKGAVCEAYALLLEQSWTSADPARSDEWRNAFLEMSADDIISGSELLRIANKSASRGDTEFAARLYQKILKRFPNTAEWECALLDTVALRLDKPELSDDAIGQVINTLTSAPGKERIGITGPLHIWQKQLRTILGMEIN